MVFLVQQQTPKCRGKNKDDLKHQRGPEPSEQWVVHILFFDKFLDAKKNEERKYRHHAQFEKAAGRVIGIG